LCLTNNYDKPQNLKKTKNYNITHKIVRKTTKNYLSAIKLTFLKLAVLFTISAYFV